MDTSSPPGTPPARHARHPSSGRALPRRSTRGPLDISDAPVSAVTSPTGSQLLSPLSPSQSRSPARSPVRSPSFVTAPSFTQSIAPSFVTAPSHSPKDFSRLLRSEIYHPLPQLEIPPPFRQASVQPPANSTLPALLATGHFRAAAILAVQLLTTSTSSTDSATIFALLYTRFACLTLCGATALAAQEVKALEDLNSSTYRDDLSDQHLVPWELRVLAVRLQGMGFSDPRRGVMGYYDLAREARLEISRLKLILKNSEHSLPHIAEDLSMWESRLSDLGIRVASALVEMEDLGGASHHLSTLQATSNKRLGLTKALLWLRLGDLKAARQCITDDLDTDLVISALCKMADGNYEDAAAAWRRLVERDSGNEMYAQNLAVCLLYSGKMEEARVLLERLVECGKSFHALTFNLSTIYELCTDRSRALKINLAEQVAALPDSSGNGWEKSNVDFKL